MIATGICLAVYIATLAPTVTSEDSGELIGAAYFFGVPHPPGYPLWTLLCGLFLKLLPIGGVAWRANLFSAVCTSVAIGFFCATLMRLRLPPLVALAGALICAFGRVLWSQSVITEVYALHFLVFILIVWSIVRWREHEDPRWLCLAGLLLGLGMSNHHTIGFTGVAAAAWILLVKPRLLRNWRVIVLTILSFTAGLLPYSYLYVRAQAEPPINWGEPKTLKALWNHVSRRQYKSSKPSAKGYIETVSWANHKGQLKLVGEYCLREYTTALACFAILGVPVMALRRHRRILLLWLLLVVCNVGIFMAMRGFGFRTRQDLWTNQVFFLPVYASLAMAITFGLGGCCAVIRGLASRMPGFVSRLGLPTAVCLVLLAVATPAVANYPSNNLRHYWYAYDHAKNILDTVLPKAMILPSGDHNTFPLLYLVLIEGYRSDVIIADKYGYIDLHLYEDMPNNTGKPRTRADRDRIEEWLIRHARRPVYYTVKKKSLVPNATQMHVGILYHLLPKGKAIDKDSAWAEYRYRNLKGVYAPHDFGADNILADWEYHRGVRQLELKNRKGALAHFEQCADYGHGIKEILNNIGSVLAEHGHMEDAIAYYHRAADSNPRYEAPRWNLARIHKSRKDLKNAERMFKELTEANSEDFRTWGELGFLAARLDDKPDRAVQYWQESLRLNPSQPQIVEQLHLYYAAARKPKKSMPPEESVAEQATTQPSADVVASQPTDLKEMVSKLTDSEAMSADQQTAVAKADHEGGKEILTSQPAAHEEAPLADQVNPEPEMAPAGEEEKAGGELPNISGAKGTAAHSDSGKATSKPAASAAIIFEDMHHDLGKVAPHSSGEYTYAFRNSGEQPLVLSKLRTSCGCTVPHLDKMEFAPGEAGKLIVVVRTPRRRKHFTQSVRFKTNDPDHANVKLTVAGTVVDPLQAKPSKVEITSDPAFQAKVQITSVDDAAFTVKEIRASNPAILVDQSAVTTQPATTAVISIRVDASENSRKNLDGSVEVVTDLGKIRVPVKSMPDS